MSKPKEAPSLLEVYKRVRAEPPPPPKPEPEPSATPQVAEPAQTPKPPGPELPAWLRINGDRMRFSLSTLGLALLITVAAVLLLGMYQIGRRSGYDQGLADAIKRAEMISGDEFHRLRHEPPTPGLLEDLGQVEPAVTADAARSDRTQRRETGFIDGLNYIWVERCDSRSDALAVQQHLADLGVATTVSPQRDEWVLISNQGFDYRLPEERSASQRLQERIKAIGKAYLKSGGRYRFDCFVNKKEAQETW